LASFFENSTASPSSPLGPIPVNSINARLRQHLGSIVSSALSAVDARRVTQVALTSLRESLPRGEVIRVVAAGKAAVGMGRAVDEVLGTRMASGVMTAAISVSLPGWQVIAATHPRPSAGSELAGRTALALADATRRDGGLLLVCLSGGASAMLAVPADGLSVEDKAATTAALLRAGLGIGDINVVRRHLSAIKGGQLAARAGRSITLAISDVCAPIEDDPVVIGSGPTAGDPTTFAEALAVVERAELSHGIPPNVLLHLQEGAANRRSGPVGPTDPRLHGAAYWLVASRREAMKAAADTAALLGYTVHVVAEPTTGAARDAGPAFVARAVTMAAGRPTCIIASGETTVEVRGRGVGGRNQEFAVAALEPLALAGPAALASVGTDGVDGPTDAGGAFVDDDTWAALGADSRAMVREALDANDTYPLLARVGGLIRTGPTGTNVGDLQVLLLA
jgi:glycerate 2-kinase